MKIMHLDLVCCLTRVFTQRLAQNLKKEKNKLKITFKFYKIIVASQLFHENFFTTRITSSLFINSLVYTRFILKKKVGYRP